MFLAANAGGNAAEDQHLRNMLVNSFGTKIANEAAETRNAGTQTDADDRDTPGGDDDTWFGTQTTDSSHNAGVDETVGNAETHTDADVDKDNGDESPFTGFDDDME